MMSRLDRHPQERRRCAGVPVMILHPFVQDHFVKRVMTGRTKWYPGCGITNEEILP